jgi:hypothetical protein
MECSGFRAPRAHWATVFAILAIVGLAVSAQAQERFGTITGTVVDQNGAPVPGAVVTVTNKSSQRSVNLVSRTDGTYVAREIEPGRYSVKVEAPGFTATEVPDVNLLVGKTLKVDANLKIGGLTESLLVVGDAPMIDTSSTLRGQNLPAEEFDNLPKARSFQDLAISAPSVNRGPVEGGLQVNGASGGENNFTVDGVSVNSQIHGHQRQDAVFEHLQEVQVKTSGLSAEYGGALGGVVSAITKSGGNEFKGSVFYYFGTESLSSSKGLTKRLVIDPNTQNSAFYVQDTGNSFDRHEIGGSLGGPIIKNKLFFFGSVSPRLFRRDFDYLLENGQTPATIHQETNSHSYFGKLTLEASSRLRFNLSALGTPESSTGTIPRADGAQENWSTLLPGSIPGNNALGYDTPQLSAAFTADYTLSSTSLLSARAGYMRDNYKVTGADTSQTWEYSTPSIGLAGVPAQFQLPARSGNLSRNSIADHDLTTRRYTNLELTKSFMAQGVHNLKVGAGLSRATNDVEEAYPNDGYVTLFWDTAFTSQATGKTGRGTYGYYTIDDIGTKGETGADIAHFFVQDTWQVTRRLTLNLGVRAENEKIPTFRPEIQKYAIQFGWGDKISPRLGLSYDVLGNGKLKASAAFGRYYDWTKYELARGSFGGDVWTTRYRTLDDPDPNKLSRKALTGRNLWTDEADSFQDHRIPSFGDEAIDPNIKPMSQDAFNAGIEYQVMPNTVVGVNYIHTNLLRTIEDIGTVVNGSETYIYGNPGEGLAKTAIVNTATVPFDLPKPQRKYDALELTMNRRFNKNWFVGSSVVISRLYGNYPGTVNSDEITAPGRVSRPAQQSTGQEVRPGTNASRAWDLDEMMFDSHGNKGVYGKLPTDRPFVGKLYGSYNFDFGTQLGVFVYGGSGTPISRSVFSQLGVPILVDGRGSMGRTPFLSYADVLVTHDLKLSQGKRHIRLEANILNVFDQRTTRHVVDFVNRVGGNGRRLISSSMNLAAQDLAKGYDYNALLAASPDASKPAGAVGAGFNDPRFGMADIFSAGRTARLSVRFLF